MRSFSILLLVGLLAFSSAPADARSEASLYKDFSGKSVKVFVEAKDSTPEHKVDAETVHAKFVEALAGRKEIRFTPVEDAASAELVISVDIRGYYWTDHDPVDMLIGVGGTAMDAAVIEDYANIQAEMAVIRAEKKLWQGTFTASVTQKSMDEATSIPLVSEKLARVFLKEAFSKKR